MAMLDVSEAHSRLMGLFAPLDRESIPLSESAGRVLAASVFAQRNQPPFAASAMDGYALLSSDAKPGAGLDVIGESVAGQGFDGKLMPGQAVRIFTGAPLPENADFIVIQEHVHRAADQITLNSVEPANDYIRQAGCDFEAGTQMPAPRRISSMDVAMLAAMNAGQVEVTRKPIVALIPTGDELVVPGEPPGVSQIHSSNTYGLKAMLSGAGADVRIMPIARDRPDSLLSAFELANYADLIVTLGGASVGDFDLVRQTALANGLTLDFYKIAMRPGKPLMAGNFRGVPMIGLPGNPVSALVCGHLFVRSAVNAMLGLPGDQPRTFAATLGRDIGPNGPRAHYMRATVEENGRNLSCIPSERQDSSLLSVLANANALMVRQPLDEAKKIGDEVEFMWF